MTALNTDTLRTYETQDDTNAVPVAAKEKIYGGALVGRTTEGYARALQAGDAAVGFAKDAADNTDGEDGDITVEVKARGKVSLFVSGLTVADVGKPVYASDDNTFTLTASGNSPVGTVVRFEKTDYAIVAFDFLFGAGAATSTLSIKTETPVVVQAPATPAASTNPTTDDTTATGTETNPENTEEE